MTRQQANTDPGKVPVRHRDTDVTGVIHGTGGLTYASLDALVRGTGELSI